MDKTTNRESLQRKTREDHIGTKGEVRRGGIPYPAKLSLCVGSPDIMASNTTTTLTSVKEMHSKYQLKELPHT